MQYKKDHVRLTMIVLTRSLAEAEAAVRIAVAMMIAHWWVTLMWWQGAMFSCLLVQCWLMYRPLSLTSHSYHCSLSWPLPRRDACPCFAWGDSLLTLSPELSSTNTHRLSPLPIKLSISYQHSSTLFIIIYIIMKSQCCHRHLIELKCNVSIRGSAWWRNASSVPEIPELQTV